jgi:hypothetical protein
VTRTRRPNSAPERRSARSAVTPATGSAAATARSTDAGTTASSAAGTAHRSRFAGSSLAPAPAGSPRG